MTERIREWAAYGKRLSVEIARIRASLAAGGLAYFVALALAPAAIALGSIAGLVLDPEDVRHALESVAARTPGLQESSQAAINALVGLVESGSTASFTIATIVGFGVAIYAASKVVYGVREAMDAAFDVREARTGIIERAWSTAITLIGLVGAAALVVLLTVVPKVLDWLGLQQVVTTTGNWILDWLIALVLVYLAVRWTLQHAPNQDVRVPWTSPGAIVGALGIIGATGVVGIYARYSSTLGAAVAVFGTAVVLLLWLYLCFMGLLWGAVIEAERQRRARDASGGEPAGRSGDQRGDTGA